MNITAKSVWSNCLKFVKDNIQSQAFKTWFEPIKPLKLNDNALSIQVPSKFFYEWLRRTLCKDFKSSITKNTW
jgi:chromosomal replication initiator protein